MESKTANPVRFDAGMHITTAAELLAAAAKFGNARGRFNDIEMFATRGTTTAEIVAEWERQSAERAEAYRQSPEGIEAAQRRDDIRRRMQGQHDRLMGELPMLDWTSDVAILNWLCAMQAPSDHIGVIIRKDTIAAAFGKRGYVPSMDTGANYRADDRHSAFRYLVGQALDGIVNGPAIHSIIHKFTDEWKERFGS